MASFDPTRQFCSGDVIFLADTIIVVIKWSKTLQNRKNSTTIPALWQFLLCPFKPICIMLDTVPGSPNDSLCQIPKVSTYVPLTNLVARKHLKKVVHLFRRSGTTWAFQHGVPLEHIMLHGTWTSDCIWRYVSTLP